MKTLSNVCICFLLSIGYAQSQEKQLPADFVPKGYIISEKIRGDLNKDGLDDCVLIIKGTDKRKLIFDEDGAKLDRNRRGIIVLFASNGKYRLGLKNDTCFSSEHEDGGVYFPPELSVEIAKGNLYIHYGHGRYGYWRYTFRYQHSDFELIGYDKSDNYGPVVATKTSVNFSTKTKITKVNTREDAQGGDEVFKTTRSKIKVRGLIRLAEIADFDEFDLGIE